MFLLVVLLVLSALQSQRLHQRHYAFHTKAVGLSGTTLFAVADTDLTGLGLKPAELAAVRKCLAQVIHRANAKPVDFWEWRAVNRRLFDTWILPLSL